MSCGDAANAWVPTLGGSAWSGTVNSNSITAIFSTVAYVAASIVNSVPAVGTWSKDSTGFHWTAALEGYTWHFNVVADSCNANGDVSAAVGSCVDGLDNTHTVSMTRTI